MDGGCREAQKKEGHRDKIKPEVFFTEEGAEIKQNIIEWGLDVVGVVGE